MPILYSRNTRIDSGLPAITSAASTARTKPTATATITKPSAQTTRSTTPATTTTTTLATTISTTLVATATSTTPAPTCSIATPDLIVSMPDMAMDFSTSPVNPEISLPGDISTQLVDEW